jgi:hypothetical protein
MRGTASQYATLDFQPKAEWRIPSPNMRSHPLRKTIPTKTARTARETVVLM